jgi:hypothetical protein
VGQQKPFHAIMQIAVALARGFEKSSPFVPRFIQGLLK